jgi:hypothetical protein
MRSLAGGERVLFGRCEICVVQHDPLVAWGGQGKGVVAVPGDVGGWRMYRRCNRILHFIRIYPFIFLVPAHGTRQAVRNLLRAQVTTKPTGCVQNWLLFKKPFKPLHEFSAALFSRAPHPSGLHQIITHLASAQCVIADPESNGIGFC